MRLATKARRLCLLLVQVAKLVDILFRQPFAEKKTCRLEAESVRVFSHFSMISRASDSRSPQFGHAGITTLRTCRSASS